MAIILEDNNRSQFPWFFVVILLVVVVVLSVAGYYLFYVKPEFVARALPANLKNIADLTNTQIDFANIESNSVFNSLKDQVPLPSLDESSFGKANPFVR